MYCSQCGTKASGKFCHQCGCPLQDDEGALLLTDADFVEEVTDWEQEVRYERIIKVDAIRIAIARHAATAPKGVSGEALLALYDKIVSSPVPLESLAAIIQPMYDSWGIHTSKKRSELLPAPIGRSIARSLCSFAKHSQTLDSTEHHDAGCILFADIPSSVCSFKGKLIVSLLKRDQYTQVTAETHIPGQMYDWGKSQRCLEHLFNDLNSDLGLPSANRPRLVA